MFMLSSLLAFAFAQTPLLSGRLSASRTVYTVWGNPVGVQMFVAPYRKQVEVVQTDDRYVLRVNAVETEVRLAYDRRDAAVFAKAKDREAWTLWVGGDRQAVLFSPNRGRAESFRGEVELSAEGESRLFGEARTKAPAYAPGFVRLVRGRCERLFSPRARAVVSPRNLFLD